MRRVPLTMRAVGLAAFLAAALLPGGAVFAASQAVLLKGDGQDQILTVTADDGSAETSITFVCEYPKLEYGVVIQAPGLTARNRSLRLRADGALLPARSSVTAAGSETFLLKGAAGKRLITRLTASSTVQAEFGAIRLRFALRDGTAAVAGFRRNCGL